VLIDKYVSRNQASIVSIVPRLQTGLSGVLNSSRGKILFLFSKISRLAVGSTKPPIQSLLQKLHNLYCFMKNGCEACVGK
jgi:hypothetical protein